MDKSFDSLRSKVLQAVEAEKSHPQLPSSRNRTILGQYIGVRLAQLRLTPEKFANSINLSTKQTVLLLQGTLPDALVTDGLLKLIAQTLTCDLNVLRIMLGHPFITAVSSQPDTLEPSSDNTADTA